MTKFMSKSNNCNQSAIIFRIILCSGISLVLGAVLGHLLRTELFADINAEGTTLVMATHDQIIVDKMQKRVITLDHGRLIGDTIGGWQL